MARVHAADSMTFPAAGFISLLGIFALSSVIFSYTLVQFALLHQEPLSSTAKFDHGSPFLLRLTPPLTGDDYSYVDDDFPSLLPNFNPGLVQMSVEETVRFSLWDAEAPMEWSSTSPPGEGAERLGPDGRLFYLSMFHEMHCWRQLERTLRDPLSTSKAYFSGHMQHCLNYLRQCSLCQADRTLEPGDFVVRNFTADRIGATHTCRDWGVVYDRATYDWSNWDSRWKDEAVTSVES